MESSTVVSVALWALGLAIGGLATVLWSIARDFSARLDEISKTLGKRLDDLEKEQARRDGAAEALTKATADVAAKQADTANKALKELLERMAAAGLPPVRHDP